jgi:hypothetical protein
VRRPTAAALALLPLAACTTQPAPEPTTTFYASTQALGDELVRAGFCTTLTPAPSPPTGPTGELTCATPDGDVRLQASTATAHLTVTMNDECSVTGPGWWAVTPGRPTAARLVAVLGGSVTCTRG